MTDLSPAAQAMLDAMYEVNMDFDGENATLAAAALEAAVNQVISRVSPPCEDFDEDGGGFLAAHITYRSKLLAIANELRGDTTATTQENN